MTDLLRSFLILMNSYDENRKNGWFFWKEIWKKGGKWFWYAIWHNRIYAGWYTVYFDWNYFSIIFIWYKCQCGERADPPGKFFYLQVVCGNNVKSEAVKTNIFIKSKASRFIGTDTKVSENFKFGNGVGYTVPGDVPVIGGTAKKNLRKRMKWLLRKQSKRKKQ